MLGITIPRGEILSYVWILSKSNRPKPIIVKQCLQSVDRWKKAKDILESAKVSVELTGLRIDLDKRLPSSTRTILNEARIAIRGGRLHRAWVRNGLIHIKRYSDTLPIRVRHRKHLENLIVTLPPPPNAASSAETLASSSVAVSSASIPTSVDVCC